MKSGGGKSFFFKLRGCVTYDTGRSDTNLKESRRCQVKMEIFL